MPFHDEWKKNKAKAKQANHGVDVRMPDDSDGGLGKKLDVCEAEMESLLKQIQATNRAYKAAVDKITKYRAWLKANPAHASSAASAAAASGPAGGGITTPEVHRIYEVAVEAAYHQMTEFYSALKKGIMAP